MPSRPTDRRFFLAFVLIAAACDAGATDPSSRPHPASLEIVAGNGQTAAAGSIVPIAPVVIVRDAMGDPVPGEEVTFAVTAGEGSLGAATVVTDSRGEARAVSWRTGTQAGMNALSASVSGLASVTFEVMATAGAAASLEIIAGDGQTAQVGQTLASDPAVRVLDAHGNAVRGAAVHFTSSDVGALVSHAVLETDATGVATLESWTLGSLVGEQILEASVSGLPAVLFHATASPGPPAAVEVLSGDLQVARVATALQEALTIRVRDAFGNALEGVPVHFEVTSGGGYILGSVQEGGGASLADATNDDGVARVVQWVLGTVAGSNTVRASVPGLPATAQFTATGQAGPATQLVRQAGDGQSAPAGTAVAEAPAVEARDAHGNPAPGAVIEFAVVEGGGDITVATQATDESGLATPGAWTLGATPGTNTLTATLAGIGSVTFTATGTSGGGGGGGGGGGSGGGSDPAGFTILVQHTGSATSSQRGVIDEAASRWSSIITGDVPSVTLNVSAGACFVPHPAINGTVDDLLVFVHITTIDGPGGILGSAGPCFIRSGSNLPVVGAIRLDAADVAAMEANGTLRDVVLHEIGHVLGIGTLWGSSLVGPGSGDPYFSGAGARTAFLDAGGSIYPGTPVPVENSGGPGTRDAHWRESVMQSELMTGWVSPAGNPLSGVTVESLADMGYVVDPGGADPFVIGGGEASMGAGMVPRVQILESPWTIIPLPVDSHGRSPN